MDPDDLTPMAYETLRFACSAVDVLRSEIGASAIEYKDEDDFLNGTLELVEEILDDPENYLDSWNYLDEVDINVFKEKVTRLIEHIHSTLSTPISKRGKPPFKE